MKTLLLFILKQVFVAWKGKMYYTKNRMYLFSSYSFHSTAFSWEGQPFFQKIQIFFQRTQKEGASMAAVGIVAEYNPFHSGHAHHIAQTRRTLGEGTPVVAVMSGNWVQRGQCAIADKWTRARWAVLGGADLVLELPTPLACRSAETLAQGAVAALKAAGVVDTLSFGAEAADAGALAEIARCLDSTGYERELVRVSKNKELPYARCRQLAVEALLGEETGAVLERPNCNLAIEYLRAAKGSFAPLAIPRVGAAHDGSELGEEFASASALRMCLEQGEGEKIQPYLPTPWPKELAPARMEWGQRAVLGKIRAMEEEDWNRLPDSGAKEGLPRRLMEAGRQATTLEEFFALAKTRRYPLARLRRLAVWALLGSPPEGELPYLRLLAFNDRGRELLVQMERAAALPILTKPAHVEGMSPEAQWWFYAESRYTDLYGLFFPQARPGGVEWRTSPQYIEG